jgi:hypothetical protein
MLQTGQCPDGKRRDFQAIGYGQSRVRVKPAPPVNFPLARVQGWSLQTKKGE